MNSFQQNIEKIFIYNNNKWKLTIEPSFDSFIINIIHSYYTYQNNFSYTYLKTIFESVNNLNEIINIILTLIDENKFKIEEDDKTISLELSSNIIFNLKRIENKNIIDILIEEIKTIKDENISMKEKMGRICDEIENKNKEIEILNNNQEFLIKQLEDLKLSFNKERNELKKYNNELLDKNCELQREISNIYYNNNQNFPISNFNMMKNQVLKRKKPKNEEINLTPVLEEDKSISFSFANNSFTSVIVLLTIIFFIISWYFLKNNGSVNNINIYITGIMFLLLLYQIIKYFQMVKFYHKIAEDDYKILKQRIHELKENNNIEQWIKMNDFIENSILRNNMFRNDYINNVLPRLRDLIKNDSLIKEQFYDEQIIWSEI